jgi:hypothetical protein
MRRGDPPNLAQGQPVDASRPLHHASHPARRVPAACRASNEIIAAVGDADAPITHNGKTRDLRWVLLAVIEETARHARHADIIREQIDGQTGR